MKAPLIAVISVGIAAAAPAVAISAKEPSSGQAARYRLRATVSDPHRPIGPVTDQTNDKCRRSTTQATREAVPEAAQPRQPADRQARRPAQAAGRPHRRKLEHWSNRGLRPRDPHAAQADPDVRATCGRQRAGLTPAVRAIARADRGLRVARQPPRDRRRRRVPRQVPVHLSAPGRPWAAGAIPPRPPRPSRTSVRRCC